MRKYRDPSMNRDDQTDGILRLESTIRPEDVPEDDAFDRLMAQYGRQKAMAPCDGEEFLWSLQDIHEVGEQALEPLMTSQEPDALPPDPQRSRTQAYRLVLHGAVEGSAESLGHVIHDRITVGRTVTVEDTSAPRSYRVVRIIPGRDDLDSTLAVVIPVAEDDLGPSAMVQTEESQATGRFPILRS